VTVVYERLRLVIIGLRLIAIGVAVFERTLALVALAALLMITLIVGITVWVIRGAGVQREGGARRPALLEPGRTHVPSGGRGTIYRMSGNRRIVSPDSDGGWNVDKPGATRASSHHDTQAEAQTAGRRYLGNSGGGELITQGRDGKIRDKSTVSPGNDPYPPPG